MHCQFSAARTATCAVMMCVPLCRGGAFRFCSDMDATTIPITGAVPTHVYDAACYRAVVIQQ